MNALLTGSQVYGTPGEKSDIDLVVLMSSRDMNKLKSLVNPVNEDECVVDPEDEYAGPGSACLRFGRLNLLVVTSQEQLDVWREGTEALLSEAPVTRERAVEEFASRRAAAKQESENRLSFTVDSLRKLLDSL